MAHGTYPAGQAEHLPKGTVLKRVFDRAAEESITDEELERILDPIRRMIMDGKFKKRRSFLQYPPIRILIAAAIIAFGLLLPFAASAWNAGGVEIPAAPVPLAATPYSGHFSEGNSLSGSVTLDGIGTGGVWLALADAESMEPVGRAVTDEDGNWSFSGIPDGKYRLAIIPPSGIEAEEGAEAGGWILFDGQTQLNLGENGKEALKGVEVRVCRTNR